MTSELDVMCVVDWVAIAAWITAVATVALAGAAIIGLFIWKSQYKRTRDHGLALRVLRSVSASYVRLDELRSPTALITDGDAAVQPSEFSDPNLDRPFRVMSARYRARKIHLTKVVEEQTAALNEALVVWEGDYGERLADLINELAEMESQVSREIATYLEGLNLRAEGDLDQPDRRTLYAPAAADEEDSFGDDYQVKIEQIRRHLAAKIRMDSGS